MPFSMAACRTVLPFSTVTGRPSIVSVTVSMNQHTIISGLRAGASGSRGCVGLQARSDGCDVRDHRPIHPMTRCSAAAQFLTISASVPSSLLTSMPRSAPLSGTRIFDHPVGHRDQDVHRLPVGVLQRDGHRHVEELAELLECSTTSVPSTR